jgi:hypothetical protein
MRPGLIPFICLVGILVASCTPAPQQQGFVAAATPQVTVAEPTSTKAPTSTARPTNTPRATAVASKTPTPTALPTSTSTNTPIPTDTATATLVPPTKTPKPTLRPPTETPESVHPLMQWKGPLKLDVESPPSWESPDYSTWKDNGGARVELVNDLGGAMKSTVLQDRGADDPLRLYPGKEGPQIDTPVSWDMSMKLMFGDEYLPEVEGDAVSIASAFYKTKNFGGESIVMASVDIFVAGKPVIIIHDPNTNEIITKYKQTGFVVQPNTPYDFRMYTDGKTIFTSFNGIIRAQGALPDVYQGIAPVMFHAGAYGHGSDVGSVIMNSPFTITFSELNR